MSGTDEPAGDASIDSPAPDENAARSGSITPGLVLVATPIGHLGDISGRALEALRTADVVLCEDTRTTARLLQEYGIRVRTEALHDHNETGRTPDLIARMGRGTRMALVSDAGTPLVSDPGYRLMRAAIEAGIGVTAVPGANAAVTALILSGLPPQPFLFLGFPPPRSAARLAAFGRLRAAERAGLAATLVWHEAPHRLAETLADLDTAFGGRSGAVARELTKRFEEVRRGSVAELAGYYAEHAPRGEITIVLGPPAEEQDTENLDGQLRQAMAGGATLRDAAALVATATGLPRKLVYARALALGA